MYASEGRLEVNLTAWTQCHPVLPKAVGMRSIAEDARRM